jgi:DNA-binding IclR family transcriptional regulator
MVSNMPKVKSANRVCSILELTAQYKEGLRHSEIAEALSIPTSSLSSLLFNLVENRYLSLDANTKRYSVGSKILLLASKYLRHLDIIEISRPFIKKSTLATGESTGLAVKNGKSFVIVYMEDSPKPVKHHLEIGAPTVLHAAAAGKAILAYGTEEEIDEYLSSVQLKPFTKNTIVEPHVLRAELKKIRAAGIAHSHGEIFEDVYAIGAPIFNMSGDVIASIAVSFPGSRQSKKNEQFIKKVVTEISREISIKMGFVDGAWLQQAQLKSGGGS